MFVDYIETPLGLFELMATDKGIFQAIFCGHKQHEIHSNEITDHGKAQLTEYFAHQRQHFTLPLDPQGTEFQKLVWHCLTKIPYGKVKSYGEVATMLNNPKASQAVGGANGRNPITLIVPCHRVIGASGSLTGYAGGLERKLWLLNHEGVAIKNPDEYKYLNIDNIKHKRQEKTQFLR